MYEEELEVEEKEKYQKYEEEFGDEDKPKKKWTANTTNQNLDGWRRINKGVEIDGPPEYERFDDQDFQEDEAISEIIPSNAGMRKRRSVKLNLLETGFTETSKDSEKFPEEFKENKPATEEVESRFLFKHKKAKSISQLDAGTIANQVNKKVVYYPKMENKDVEGLPPKQIYIGDDPEVEKKLPPGVVNESQTCAITIGLNFYKSDWDLIYGLIKRERDTIKQFSRRAIVKFAEEKIQFEHLKNKITEELIREELLEELKDKIRRELTAEKVIWQARYQERDPDAVKLYPSLNEEMRKKLADEEADRVRLAERLKKKVQKDMLQEARDTRARARALSKQPGDSDGDGIMFDSKEVDTEDKPQENNKKEIILNPDTTEDIFNTAPEEAINHALEFRTEGVMPEEKGIFNKEEEVKDDGAS